MTRDDDPFAHHVAAQDEGGAWARAASELRRGRKTSHWMWFVFPQLGGLGHSDMARHYAIADVAEARRYLAHPVLGPRLLEMTRIAMTAPAHDPVALLGPIDAMKLRSSLTLFDRASTGQAPPGQAMPFADALARLYDGAPCTRTLALLDEGLRAG